MFLIVSVAVARLCDLENSCRRENYFCSASMLLPHPNTTHMNTPKSGERLPKLEMGPRKEHVNAA